MRILIDTNIIIYREDNHIIPAVLQDLLKSCSHLKFNILIHPKSVDELKKDTNEDRQQIALSKLNTYPILEFPLDPKTDNDFMAYLGQTSKSNDEVDNSLLYSVYRNAVDFLITEDKGIHKKAVILNLKERVLSIDEAHSVFRKSLINENVANPPALKKLSVNNLDINDGFFDSLKEEYGLSDFKDWFYKISRAGRKCWVHFKEDGTIGALLVYKIEDETIDSSPQIPANKRLKLATFKVSYVGNKIGELFIKLAIEYSIKNRIDELYLTHFTKEDDHLVDLITEYGFCKTATKRNGEDIYLKKLIVPDSKIKQLSPIEISKTYYPTFYDGEEVNKFIIPIQPEFHQRLFTDYKNRQTTFLEYTGEFIVEGNTIKKAYISNSKTKKISTADILLFYRSEKSEITSIGVVEKTFSGLQSKEEIMRHVGKRTVYTLDEIEKKADKPVLVILFTLHFHFKNPIKLSDLTAMGISHPQSISQTSHEKYILIKNKGGINERFTVN
ncbi:MAG: hypothetical protein CVV36_02855 [Candidatus Methanoperedenaceae archaeon HGW-Methanoperedenaceae-1]|nr:MAG: hypothetical protein CVV36_02855 [Candidatus Methanoperedenaceae archaeon HGW-Methanoperedenaceae-1]